MKTHSKWLIATLFIFSILVVVTQDTTYFYYPDFGWYLNRADLLWNGVFDQFFVYTLGYPILVGAINLGINNLILSAFIVNIVALFGIGLAFYLLSLRLFNPTVSIISVSLIFTNPFIVDLTRELETHATFLCLVMWSLIVLLHVLDAPTLWKTTLLGCLVTFSFYTRFEGISTGFFLFIAFIVLAHQISIKRATQLLLPAGLIFGLGVLFYFGVLSQATEARGTGVGGLFSFLTSNPPRLDLVSWRINDLITVTFNYWHPILWIIGFATLAYRRTHSPKILWMVFIYFLITLFIVFISAPWSSETKNRFTIMLPALFFAWGISEWGHLLRIKGLVWLLTIIFCAIQINQLLPIYPPFAFAQMPLPNRDISETIEMWQAQSEWHDSRIYTFCSQLAPFVQNRYFVMYRLGFTGYDDPNQRTSPTHLLPVIHQENALYMQCNGASHGDWQAFFRLDIPTQQAEFGYGLELIYSQDIFTVYRVVSGD